MPKINKEECDGCGACVAVCPKSAVIMPDTAVIDAALCIDCKICKNVCPLGAIK
ncbi:MAG: 4Fe-4S binding protein [Chitinispirillales bacterium]|nr:4Fe-4S binding protein [Chitinispirillales bacterium]